MVCYRPHRYPLREPVHLARRNLSERVSDRLDMVRPVVGGLYTIATAPYDTTECTMGFQVSTYNGNLQPGFLTAAYPCTAAPFTPNITTTYWQNLPNSQANQVSTYVAVDPPLFVPCPNGHSYGCRRSNVALTQYTSGVSSGLHLVAHTAPNSQTILSDYQIVSTDYDAKHFAVGTTLTYVGIGGEASGPITMTGATVYLLGGAYLINQVIFQVTSGQVCTGQAGSPVFENRGGLTIEAEGVVSGSEEENTSLCIVSTINGFKTDCGGREVGL